MTNKDPRRHHIGCPGDDSDLRPWRGHRGDAMIACSRCRRATLADLPAVDAADTASSEPSEPARTTNAAPPSRHVCREHFAPVSHRGKGCPTCDNPPPPTPKSPAVEIYVRRI